MIEFHVAIEFLDNSIIFQNLYIDIEKVYWVIESIPTWDCWIFALSSFVLSKVCNFPKDAVSPHSHIIATENANQLGWLIWRKYLDAKDAIVQHQLWMVYCTNNTTTLLQLVYVYVCVRFIVRFFAEAFPERINFSCIKWLVYYSRGTHTLTEPCREELLFLGQALV